MSKIGNLVQEIQELDAEGFSPLSISVILGVAINLVYDCLDPQNEYYCEAEYD